MKQNRQVGKSTAVRMSGQQSRRDIRSDDLAETPNLVFAMSVDMSPRLGLALGSRLALVNTFSAATAPVFGRPGFGVTPWAILPNVAMDFVGAGADD